VERNEDINSGGTGSTTQTISDRQTMKQGQQIINSDKSASFSSDTNSILNSDRSSHNNNTEQQVLNAQQDIDRGQVVDSSTGSFNTDVGSNLQQNSRDGNVGGDLLQDIHDTTQGISGRQNVLDSENSDNLDGIDHETDNHVP
jgi:hypothetical protein